MTSKYAEELLKRITYNTSITGTDIAFDNLKRIHASLTDDNILSMAYVASNPAICYEDRQILTKCMKMKAEAEYNQLQKFLQLYHINSEPLESSEPCAKAVSAEPCAKAVSAEPCAKAVSVEPCAKADSLPDSYIPDCLIPMQSSAVHPVKLPLLYTDRNC